MHVVTFFLLSASTADAEPADAAYANASEQGLSNGVAFEDDSGLSCDHLLFGSGLSYHLLQSDDGATWDYDPDGEAITRVVGSLSSTNRIDSTTYFAADHWLSSIRVFGQASVNDDGDEAASYEETWVSRDGDVVVWEVEQERFDCTLSRVSTDEDGVTWGLDGTYTAEGFLYAEDQIPALWYGSGRIPHASEGTLLSDGTFTETWRQPSLSDEDDDAWLGYSHTRSGDADGNDDAEWTWVEWWSGAYAAGTYSRDMSGTWSIDYEFDGVDDGYWTTYTVDRDGVGEGSWSAYLYEDGEWTFTECDLTLAADSCSISCPTTFQPRCFVIRPN